MEPGESLEAAVAREIAEKAGVHVADVRYVQSQPWPFPASLMLGFRATYAGGRPALCDGELEAVRWFHRDEVAAACAAEPGSAAALLLPRRWPSRFGCSISGYSPRDMPGLNPIRRVPWFIVLQAVMAAREHWNRLEPGERADLQQLVRKSHGRPHNLSARDRARLRELAGKLDVIGLGRGLLPFGGGGRRRGRGRRR